MPRNGSGTYTLPATINPVVTQTLITSNWANTTLSDVAAALTQSISRDGQSPPTANLPMGGFRHTGAGDPALLTQYLTLGYGQDGRYMRLTTVAGTPNAITAVLPGGSTALVKGQLIQLIPASTNTGAVTLNINSIGVKSVVTQVGNALTAGNLVAGNPYLLMYDGVKWIIITGAGASSIAQSAMSGWDRPTPDGPYPAITIVNSTTVAVPAGTGRIIHPSARDFAGVKEVSWAAQNVTITNIASAWNTILAVDADGIVQQFTSQQSPVWGREYILLGLVVHINGTVNSVQTKPTIYGDMSYASYDMAILLQNSLIRGGRITGNDVDLLHINIEAGSVFDLGRAPNNVNSPNIIDFPAEEDISFFRITGTSGVSAEVQNAPITFYDPSGLGVVTAIPDPAQTATIHRLYYIGGEYLWLYGQNLYNDLDTALSQIPIDDANTVFPAKLINATLLGYVVAQKNCVDLNDASTARLVPKGGFDFSIGSSGSINDAPINGLVYGRKDANWAETILMPRGSSGTYRTLPYYTNISLRWDHGANQTVESGGNAGSNWVLRAYNDAGVFTGNAIEVFRSNRVVNFPNNPTSNSNPIINTTNTSLVPYIGAPGITDWNVDVATVDGTGSFNTGLGTAAGDPSDNGFMAVTMRRSVNASTQFGTSYAADEFWYRRSNSSSGGVPVWQPWVRVWDGVNLASPMTTDTAQNVTAVKTIRGDLGGGVTVQAGATGAEGTSGPIVSAFTDNAAGTASIRVLRGNISSSSGFLFRTKSGGVDVNALAIRYDGSILLSNDANYNIAPASGGYWTFNSANGITINTPSASIDAELQLAVNGTLLGGILTDSNRTMMFNNGGATGIQLRPTAQGSTTGQMTLSPAGVLTTSSDISSGGDVISATRIFAAATAGTVSIRPNGPGSTTGQLVIDTVGNTTVSGGGLVVAGNISSSTRIFAATTAGTIGIRPNGSSDNTNQTTIATDGTLTAGGPIIGTGNIRATAALVTGTRILAADTAGTLFFRPNGAASATGQATIGTDGVLTSGADVVMTSGIVRSVGTATVVGTTSAGSVTIRPNGGSGTSTTGQTTFTTSGASGPNFTATSDARLKDDIDTAEPRDLAESIRMCTYTWKETGAFGIGVIAQEVEDVAPEYVVIGPDGIRSVDKAGLALEMVMAQSRRIQRLSRLVTLLAATTATLMGVIVLMGVN